MNFRKYISAALVVLFTIMYCNVGIAVEMWDTYTLDEIGVEISFPSDFDVFTRNMSNNSPALLDYGLTAEEVNEILISGNIFLDAYSADGTKEIAVSMIGSTISDFNVWNDNILNFMVSAWTEEFEKAGTIIDKYDIHHNGSMTFVRLWKRSSGDPNLHGLQYYTTYNYQAINITMQSYNGQITAADEKQMLEIVNRAVFGESRNTVVYEAKTDASDFQYEILPNGKARITGYTGKQASITIPESINGYVIAGIGKLERNSSVTTLGIPASVEDIEGNPFEDFSSLKAIAVDNNNTSFVADEGVLYTFDKKELVCYPSQSVNKAFVVPSETKVIGENAFRGSDNLVFVEISEGVEVIERDAFACADGITDIYLPKTLKQIDGNPFAFSFGLTSISVDPLNSNFYAQDGVLFNRTEKALQAFPHNKSIEHYTIPEGVRSIGENAFNYHSGNISITFPRSLREIGSRAFDGCSDFSFSELMSNVVQIDEFAFDDCDTIESITIHSDAVVGKRAFGDCSGLINVYIEEGVTKVSDYMFFACESLQNVELPSTITSIGEHAFRMCEALKTLSIPASVKFIGECAFDDCPDLVIRVEENSYAAKYCQDNNLNYEYGQTFGKTLNQNSYFDPVSGISFLLPVGYIQED